METFSNYFVVVVLSNRICLELSGYCSASCYFRKYYNLLVLIDLVV